MYLVSNVNDHQIKKYKTFNIVKFTFFSKSLSNFVKNTLIQKNIYFQEKELTSVVRKRNNTNK